MTIDGNTPTLNDNSQELHDADQGMWGCLLMSNNLLHLVENLIQSDICIFDITHEAAIDNTTQLLILVFVKQQG